MKNLFTFLICLSLVKLHGQTGSSDLQAYLDSTLQSHNIPALAAGISVDGEVKWMGASGFANMEEQETATPHTRFRIASITKVLTAALALKLEQVGKLDLDAQVQRYLPDYRVSKRGELKVIHLLTHTSGIRHSRGSESRSTTRHFANQREACRQFEEEKLRFKPGSKYQYSSYGFTVLGAVIEAASGQSYYNALNEYILQPAGMTRTVLDDVTVAGRAALYKKSGDAIVADFENDLSVIYAAGGLLSTAEDLLRFVNALNSGKLISMDRVERMLVAPVFDGKVLEENGGLGWNIWKHDKHGQVCHRVGGQSGSSALLLSYRDAGVTVVLLSNQAVLDPIWEITNGLVGFGLEMR